MNSVEDLLKAGIRVQVCLAALLLHGIEKEDLIEEVEGPLPVGEIVEEELQADKTMVF